MRAPAVTPLGALGRGVLAGAVGTAAMTAWQEAAARLRRSSGETSGDDGDDAAPGGDPWESAPAPAKVARRVLEGVFRRDVPADRIGLLTNATHWTYGTLWGGVYGLVHGTVRASPALAGLVFGGGVWTMSYVGLVPMGLYQPPWKYSAKTVALDLSYHIVYGLGVAGAYEATAPARRRA